MSALKASVFVMVFALFASQVTAQSFSRSIAGQYRVAYDVTYLKLGMWEGKLDVFYRTDNPGPHPTVIWIHGGDSMNGTKGGSLLSVVPYLEWGWNVVNVEPRLPGQTLAPAAF